MLACLFYLNKSQGPGCSLVFSGGERQAMPGQSEAMARQSIALACLFYLKELRPAASQKVKWEIKKSPAISDGGSEATFKGKLQNHRLPRLKQTHRRQYKD